VLDHDATDPPCCLLIFSLLICDCLLITHVGPLITDY
jgi:hypothetical protein